MLNNYLPGEIWVSYLVLGGLFVILGLVLWTQKGSATLPEPAAGSALAPAPAS
jgi:hypothetical protein